MYIIKFQRQNPTHKPNQTAPLTDLVKRYVMQKISNFLQHENNHMQP